MIDCTLNCTNYSTNLFFQDLASELGYDFFEASAKTSDSVQSTFHALVSSICVQVTLLRNSTCI